MTEEATATGLLDLEFEASQSGRTHLVRRAQRFPLRLTVPLHLDPAEPGMAFVYVQNPTGGLFAGDRLLTRVRAGQGTRVHVTTQSATKAYQTSGDFACQRLLLELGESSYAEYVPDLLIPQRGAELEQAVEVRVSAGAALVATELIGPGRLARGEVFEYERISLKTAAFHGETELFVDTLLLEPKERSPRSRGALGPFLYLGNLYAVVPNQDAEKLVDQLRSALPEFDGALAAVSGLPTSSGATVRVLAETSAKAVAMLEEAWKAARLNLIGTPPPPRRK